MMRRYGNRKDGNHRINIDDLKNVGFSVADTSDLGDGFPDIVVGGFGINFLFETKDPKQPPSARVLRPSQIRFRDLWKGQYDVIECADDAIRIITRGR